VGIWGSWCVKIWEDVWGYVRLFGMRDVRVDLWGWFIEICEWCDGWEKIIYFFKGVKCEFANLPLCFKIFK